MDRLFDAAAIHAQIANLLRDRQRIDLTIASLQSALRQIEGLESHQRELGLFETETTNITLHDAVKKACINLVDGITRQRVMETIEKTYPFLNPKSPSVAASLISLTKGNQPMLKVAIEGRGRSPSYYSTEPDTVHRLSADEIEALLDESAIKGEGGWQSLWLALQRAFDKKTGQITLTAGLRARIYQYYHFYGTGGWQNRVVKVFRRELPHLWHNVTRVQR